MSAALRRLWKRCLALAAAARDTRVPTLKHPQSVQSRMRHDESLLHMLSVYYTCRPPTCAVGNCARSSAGHCVGAWLGRTKKSSERTCRRAPPCRLRLLDRISYSSLDARRAWCSRPVSGVRYGCHRQRLVPACPRSLPLYLPAGCVYVAEGMSVCGRVGGAQGVGEVCCSLPSRNEV